MASSWGRHLIPQIDADSEIDLAFMSGRVQRDLANCYAVACPWRTTEPGHISLYAGTHERDGAIFWLLNDYTQDADLWMGGNGKATLGHKNGIGNMESAGAQFGREGAFSLVCFEVQDIPQTLPQPDSDGDGLSDALELTIGTLLDDSDTDNDGVADYEEINFDGDAFDYNPATDLNPFDVDTDGDGADDVPLNCLSVLPRLMTANGHRPPLPLPACRAAAPSW